MLTEIVGNFVADLGTTWSKIVQKLNRQLFVGKAGAQRPQAFTQPLLGELMGEQFFESQPVLSPMMAEGKLFYIRIGRRLVQIANPLSPAGCSWWSLASSGGSGQVRVVLAKVDL